MRYEEMMLDWLMAGECLDDGDEEPGLSEEELGRQHYLAEHPELADPSIWFLPERGHRRGGRQ